MLQDFAGLLFTTGEGIGCCRGWLGTADLFSHVMTHKNFQTKPTAVGRLLTADALVRSWIEIINNPPLLLLLRLSGPFNSLWPPLQPEWERAEWAERQTSSTIIFVYKSVKRENGEDSAEKKQQKANCALLCRAKVRADIVRLRSVTQGKPKSKNFPDMGVNRGQK